MAENSKITWCDDTFNGWLGCQHVHLYGPDGKCIGCECDGCYAAWMVFHRMGFNGQTHSRNGTLKVPFKPEVWGLPRSSPRWRTSSGYWRQLGQWNAEAAVSGRRLVFMFSLSDWAEAHPQVAPWLVELIDLIEANTHLDYLMLTKRPERVPKIVPSAWMHGGWPAHVWVGTSAGRPETLNLRYPRLMRLPAPVTFLSMEPLIARTDPTPALKAGVNWIISGGESGPGSDIRPRIDADSDWYRLIRDKTVAAGVPYFHKQGAGPRPGTGHELDGRLWHQWPDTRLGPLGGVRTQPSAELIAPSAAQAAASV
jgi:protein gp37